MKTDETTSQDSELPLDSAALQIDWLKHHAKPPSVLYHYTTGDGLMGILRSGRIWATHAAFLNDPSELRYAARLISEVMKEVIPEKQKRAESAAAMGFLGFVFKVTQAALLKGDSIQKWIDALASSLAQQDVYLVSFCSKGDLLSQWRGYGASGGGYAIGFAGGLIETPPGAPGAHVLLRKVIYDPSTQKAIVRDWVKRLHELGESLSENYRGILDPPSKSGENARVNWVEILQRAKAEGRKRAEQLKAARQRLARCQELFTAFLTECLVCFKDPAYSEEQEWRAIHYGTGADKMGFRSRGAQLIPYVELDFSRSDANGQPQAMIRGVIFGPTLDPELTKRSVTMLAKSTVDPKSSIFIRPSRVPFRG